MEVTEDIVSVGVRQKDVTVTRLVQSTVDTLKLFKSGEINPTAGFVLVGMKSSFPDRFSNTQLRQSSDLNFFGAMVWIGVEVNDAVDMIPQARANQDQETIEKIFGSWKWVLRSAQKSAGESEFKNQLLESYQREILYCEKRAGAMENPSAQLVTEYREMMNAISVVHNAAALLGDKELSERIRVVGKENLTWEALHDKYSWILSGNPQNKTEEKLCGLYNLVMGIQIIDDQQDVEDDRKLGLHTMAMLDEDITAKANEYFKEAEKFGITPSAWKGARLVFSTLKGLQKRFPRAMGGRRERLLNNTRQAIAQEL